MAWAMTAVGVGGAHRRGRRDTAGVLASLRAPGLPSSGSAGAGARRLGDAVSSVGAGWMSFVSTSDERRALRRGHNGGRFRELQ